ncbi:MAG: hypothetical protein KTR21_17400 [Rhodobacteraceae bacterium]|nr:hypothetical protein [Paracoccaceae bacterium]
MTRHEQFDAADSITVNTSTFAPGVDRTDPQYQLWFALAADPMWKLGGKLAGGFLALATIASLIAALAALLSA